ncbi:MAG: glycosyltransferase [Candidatus Binatia bacterium]
MAKFYHPFKGGMETVLKLLSEGLRGLGHEVTCLVANSSRRTVKEHVDGVRVVRAASFGVVRSVSVSPTFFSAFRALVREADIIHIHEQNPLADLAALVAPRTVPLVVTCHSAIVRQRLGRIIWQPVLVRVQRHAHRVIVTSPPMTHTVVATAARPPAVIPFGIDLSTIEAPDGARAAGSDEPLLLSVGRLVGYKGLEYLIAALADVPDARLVLVGNGPLQSRLHEQAVARHVENRVEFAGEVSDTRLAALYRRCTVFVLPSVSPAEAFGMVQLEAMAYGKPVVSTALPTGVPWVNRDGETGLIVPPRSPQALAQALNTLLASPALRQRMGAAGRRRVHETFTAEHMVRCYAGIYAQAVSAVGAPAAKNQ